MSGYARIPNWLLRDPSVSLTAKVVYGALLTHAKPDGTDAHPSYETLMAETGCSRSTIHRTLRDLRDLGLLTWERSRVFNRYTISTPDQRPDVSPMTPLPSARCVTHDTSDVSPMTDQMCHQRHENKHPEQAPGTSRASATAPARQPADEPMFDMSPRCRTPEEQRERRGNELRRAWNAGWPEGHDGEEAPETLAAKMRGRVKDLITKDPALLTKSEDEWQAVMVAGAYAAGKAGKYELTNWIYQKPKPRPSVSGEIPDWAANPGMAMP